jgi:hypothetical protein
VNGSQLSGCSSQKCAWNPSGTRLKQAPFRMTFGGQESYAARHARPLGLYPRVLGHVNRCCTPVFWRDPRDRLRKAARTGGSYASRSAGVHLAFLCPRFFGTLALTVSDVVAAFAAFFRHWPRPKLLASSERLAE